jgi:ribonuclease BN (tRNA processing enzyme)
VDLGHGSVERLVETGMVGETLQSALMNVRAILFTHLHSDHITEWPAVYMDGP